LNRKITVTPTETPLSAFASTPANMMTYWVDAATKVTSVTTKAYVAGLNVITEQQKAARQASLEWFTGLTNTQSEVTSLLVESSDSVAGELTEVAEEVTQHVSQTGAEVAKRSRDAAITTQREAQTPTPLPQPSARSRPASRSTAQPGPARWTREAYDALTAAEINEKLPQFSQRELREVRTYEQAHQARQTVLDKVGTLQGQEPVLGYDELNVPEIQKRLAEGDEKLAASVRDYERLRKSREGVLHASETKLNQS
jgi:hypothetical protein